MSLIILVCLFLVSHLCFFSTSAIEAAKDGDIAREWQYETLEEKEATQARLVSLDDRAKEYVQALESSTGQSIRWHDMYLKQQHLRDNPDYHKYKINVRVGRVLYDSVTSDVKRPGDVFTAWYHNAGDSTTTHTFSHSIQYKAAYTWSITASLKVGISATLSFGVPEVFGGSTTVSTELSVGSTISETETRTDTFSTKHEVHVTPHKSAKATFVVQERDMIVPWEAEIIIGGYIAIWFEEKYNGHWLWFHPISSLVNEDFRYHGNSELTFTQRGEFNGVRGVEANFRVTEYPLQPEIMNGRSDIPTGIPQLITNNTMYANQQPEAVAAEDD